MKKAIPTILMILALGMIILAINNLIGKGRADNLLRSNNVTNIQTNRLVDLSKIGVFGIPNKIAAQDLGVKWTRLPNPHWSDYTTEEEKAKVKTQFQDLKSADVNIIATIRANNPSKINCPAIKQLKDNPSLIEEKFQRDVRAIEFLSEEDLIRLTKVSCYPKDMNEYLLWVKSTVSELKNYVAAWQIENEVYASPSIYWAGDEIGKFDNFINLFEQTSKVIRGEDPGKPILAPGIAFGSQQPEFNTCGQPINLNRSSESCSFCTVEKNVKELLSKSCSNFDVMDIHLYHTIESIPNRVRWLKGTMKETNCTKPIWSTEISGPTIQDPAYSGKVTEDNFLEKQAEEVAPRLQTALNSGVEKVIYFLYKDAAGEGVSQPQTLGLVDSNGDKKPAYFSFKEFLEGR